MPGSCRILQEYAYICACQERVGVNYGGVRIKVVPRSSPQIIRYGDRPISRLRMDSIANDRIPQILLIENMSGLGRVLGISLLEAGYAVSKVNQLEDVGVASVIRPWMLSSSTPASRLS